MTEPDEPVRRHKRMSVQGLSLQTATATATATATGRLRVRQRDAAIRDLYLAQYGQLAGWAAHLVGDRELAHDFATEAFTRLLSRWQTVSDPRPWLYMTVANQVKDHWRKSERERRALAKVATIAEPESQAAYDPAIRDLVQRLPERLRSVVLLHYYADLPVRDVAAALGKAEGSVKRSLYDARQQLLAALDGDPR